MTLGPTRPHLQVRELLQLGRVVLKGECLVVLFWDASTVVCHLHKLAAVFFELDLTTEGPNKSLAVQKLSRG